MIIFFWVSQNSLEEAQGRPGHKGGQNKNSMEFLQVISRDDQEMTDYDICTYTTWNKPTPNPHHPRGVGED